MVSQIFYVLTDGRPHRFYRRSAKLRIVYKYEYLFPGVITTKSCAPKFRAGCNIQNTPIQ